MKEIISSGVGSDEETVESVHPDFKTSVSSPLMVRLAFVSQCTEDGLGCVHYFADSGSQEQHSYYTRL